MALWSCAELYRLEERRDLRRCRNNSYDSPAQLGDIRHGPVLFYKGDQAEGRESLFLLQSLNFLQDYAQTVGAGDTCNPTVEECSILREETLQEQI